MNININNNNFNNNKIKFLYENLNKLKEKGNKNLLKNLNLKD